MEKIKRKKNTPPQFWEPERIFHEFMKKWKTNGIWLTRGKKWRYTQKIIAEMRHFSPKNSGENPNSGVRKKKSKSDL